MSDQELHDLLARHAAVMSAAIRRVCARRHRELIPDVEQEVRLALWGRLQGGKKIEHPASYLYKVALTTALTVLRRCAPAESRIEKTELDGTGKRSAGSAGLTAAERAHLLKEMLAALPEDQARALRAYLAGFNHRAVARLFGWTEAVARHRIYRGIDALRTAASEREDDA